MKQIVLIEARDLMILRDGGILTLSLNNGQTIDLGLDGAQNGALMKRKPSASSRPVPPPARKRRGDGVTYMRGDCPHCTSRKILLYNHIRRTHPGKPIPYTGAGYQCLHCAQRFPDINGTLRHSRVKHKKTYTVANFKKEAAQA